MNRDELAWHDRAACKGDTKRMFAPEHSYELIAELKERCSYCPVLQQCKDFAETFETTYRSTFGIYGGETAAERVDRRNKLPAPVKECPSPSRSRSIAAHRRRGEALCNGCAGYAARRQAEQKRWEHTKELIRKGYSEHDIRKMSGTHWTKIRKLRAELASASLTS